MTDTITGVTIVIPAQPAYAFNPNRGKHWTVRARAADAAHDAAGWALKHVQPVHGPVNLHWTVRLAKGRRVLDRDNMTICLKPYQDSLVAAGVIDGDTAKIVRAITVDQVIWSDHRGQPEIVATITPARESA